MNDTPKPSAADAYETMESLICEMQGLRDELADVKRERDQWKSKFVQANKDYGFELRDPCGTIWDHAKKLQQECDNLQDQLDEARMESMIFQKEMRRLLETLAAKRAAEMKEDA